MELPSDPKNLLYGVYNKAGDDITKLKDDEEKKAYWALSDDEDEFKTNRLLPFDADVDYNYM